MTSTIPMSPNQLFSFFALSKKMIGLQKKEFTDAQVSTNDSVVERNVGIWRQGKTSKKQQILVDLPKQSI